MDNILPSKVPVKSSEIVFKAHHDGWLILKFNDDYESFHIHGLSRFVWDHIDGVMNEGKIVETILEKGLVPRQHAERFKKDTSEFLQDLAKIQLIHWL